MVVGRRPTDRTAVSMRKLKMIRGAGMPQHHTVEAVMIFEPIQDLQPQSVAVKANQCIEIICGPGNAQLRDRVHEFELIRRLLRLRSLSE